MGGRGASLGISKSGKKYGTEYTTLAELDNIKIIKYNDSTAATAPMETMTRNRVYATIDKYGDLKYLTFYDTKGKRYEQIDLKGKPHHDKEVPHTHYGYEHDENGEGKPTKEEYELIEKIEKFWKKKRKELKL